MFSNVIEETLKSVEPGFTTDIFIVVIFGLFILSILWTKINKCHRFTDNAPNLLTSIGILGTFLGIVIGLLSFNTNDIDGSIGQLLDGLKVAFITSLVGMFCAIVLKGLSTSNLISPKIISEVKEDISVVDLYNIMNSQNENIIKLQSLLSDSNDSSLTGQIKLMRSELSDSNKNIYESLKKYEEPLLKLNNIEENTKHTNAALKDLDDNFKSNQQIFKEFSTELWQQLENFADILSKSATEQIIEALKNVISEFNDKLTEQFGQNFKDLNEAVKDLVIWQNNYKTQLSDMKNQFDLSVDSMGTMEKSIENISTNSKIIPENMNHLESVMKVNQHQIENLSNHLEAFKDIRDRAVEAVPEIRVQIDNTIEGITKASTELIEGVSNSTEKISSVMVQSADDFSENVSKTNGALIQSSDTLTKSSTEIKDQLTLTIQDINKNVREMIENISKNSEDINKSFKEISTNVETELSATNQKMSKSFNNSIDELQGLSKKISNTLLDVTSELKNNIQNVSEEQVRQTSKVLNGLDKSIESTIQETSNNISKQIDTIDKITEQEINNVMNAMGKALGSISNQFTNDYQKLVNEMKKIVEHK